MKNIPKKIYLQICEDKETFKYLDFNDLRGVTLQKERVFKTDIKYVLPPDWKELRQKFFDECVSFSDVYLTKMIDLTPDEMFEWFKKNIK